MKRALRWLPLAGLLAAAPAGATTVQAYDLDDLTVRSDRILRGTVVDLESRWDGRWITTTAYVAVDECLKGPCQEPVVEVRVLGGRVDDLEMRVEGMARFDLDEQVVLFLEPAEDGTALRPTGLAQGKFRLIEGADEPAVMRDLDDLQLVGPEAGAAQALKLADLRALVSHVDAVLSR
jgi:hypothetical protein